MPPSNSGPMPDEMEAKARRCFVCGREMPGVRLAVGWEHTPQSRAHWSEEYRCPKHRHDRPALATIGEIQKAKP